MGACPILKHLCAYISSCVKSDSCSFPVQMHFMHSQNNSWGTRNSRYGGKLAKCKLWDLLVSHNQPHGNCWRTNLHDIQWAQEPIAVDYPCHVDFTHWVQQQNVVLPSLGANVLFTRECIFTYDDAFNIQWKCVEKCKSTCISTTLFHECLDRNHWWQLNRTISIRNILHFCR